MDREWLFRALARRKSVDAGELKSLAGKGVMGRLRRCGSGAVKRNLSRNIPHLNEGETGRFFVFNPLWVDMEKLHFVFVLDFRHPVTAVILSNSLKKS